MTTMALTKGVKRQLIVTLDPSRHPAWLLNEAKWLKLGKTEAPFQNYPSKRGSFNGCLYSSGPKPVENGRMAGL